MTKEEALKRIHSAYDNFDGITSFYEAVIQIVSGIDVKNTTVNINSLYDNLVILPVVDQFDPKLTAEHLNLIKGDVVNTINSHLEACNGH